METNKLILGAICGDVIGSFFERRPNLAKTEYKNTKEFWHLCAFTDDTVMTVAVMDWLLQPERTKETLITSYKKWGRKYPNAGYGGGFFRWLIGESTEPYNSWGNGSAMRVSPVGWVAKNIDEAMELAKITAEVTHNHPEGIKGAQAVAVAVCMARNFSLSSEIKETITDLFGYNLDFLIEDIRPKYVFHVSCQKSVPESIKCVIEADSVQEAIENAISLGGDTDTMAAIAGSIAEAYFGTGTYNEIKDFVWEKCLPDDIKEIITAFSEKYHKQHKCCKCGKTAVWCYAPAKVDEDMFYCDDCVPRGCSCNVHALDEEYMDEELSYYKSLGNGRVRWYDKEGLKTDKYTDEWQPNSAYVEALDEKGRREPCCEYIYDKEGFDYFENEE